MYSVRKMYMNMYIHVHDKCYSHVHCIHCIDVPPDAVLADCLVVVGGVAEALCLSSSVFTVCLELPCCNRGGGGH